MGEAAGSVDSVPQPGRPAILIEHPRGRNPSTRSIAGERPVTSPIEFSRPDWIPYRFPAAGAEKPQLIPYQFPPAGSPGPVWIRFPFPATPRQPEPTD